MQMKTTTDKENNNLINKNNNMFYSFAKLFNLDQF